MIAIVLALLIARRPDAFGNPQFWAEDAVLFHMQAEGLGWSSLIHPAMGYHHAIPRIVAFLACRFVDAARQPAAFSFSMIAFVLLVVGSLATNRWRGPPALALACAVVLVAQGGEVFCSLTNLQWVAALAIVITAVVTPPPTRGGKTVEALALLAVGLTGPFAVVLLPLHIFRCRQFGRSALPATLALTLAATIQGITMWTMPWGGSAEPDLTHTSWAEIIGLRLFVQTMLPMEIWPATGTGCIVIGLAGAAFTVLAAFYPGPERRLRITFFAAALLVQLAVGFRISPVRDLLIGLDNGSRYFYDARVLLAWLFMAVATVRLPRALRLGAMACLAGWLTVALLNFRIPALPNLHWPDYAEAVRAGRPADIPVNPVPYVYHYAGRPNAKP